MRMTGVALVAALGLAVPVGAQDDPMAALRAAQAQVAAPTATETYGTDPQQFGELRIPAGKGPFPLAVVIHGGCWDASYESVKGMGPLAEALRERGIATWSIEYRRVGNPGGGYPGTFQDVGAAIDALPGLAKRYPIDLKRVALVGHSAGAHLALWAASRARLGQPWAGRGKVKPVSVVPIDGPAAVAPFVGLDAKVCGKPVIVPFMGGTPDTLPLAYGIADAGARLPFGMRQLIVLGELGPYMTSYLTRAKAMGDRVETLAPAGANHFDIITPGTPNGKIVADAIAAKAFVK